MSFFAFIVPLLLVSTSVKQGFAYNVGYVTIPLFEMLVKNLPQNELDTADEYANLTEYYNKLKILDAWKANPFLTLKVILRDKATTVITDGRTLYERDAIKTEDLLGYNCTRWCYNVSVPQILNVTGWSVERLDGKISPVVRLEDIHNAVVKAIEKRFCCNMAAIAIELNIDNGVKLCAPYIDVWEKFVPHINNATIKCKAKELNVTTSELAELLRTTLPSLLSYDLHQLDSNFFPLYEDLVNRKNLFETRSIITGVLANAPQWQRETMSSFASIVSQFTVRDLEILYRWRSPQLFAIQNIPMSIYLSGCNTISSIDSLFKLSETLFGFPDKLPPCDIAFLLARSLNEVNTKFTVASIDNQNVLEIFRTESQKYSWFDFYQLLQLKIDDGIWIETPRLSQVAVFSGVPVSGIKENSIPQVVSFIQNFNNSGILNAIMASNYASFLTTLLNTYGYSAQGLAQAAGITQTQLNSLTIQRAHSYILTSIIARYDIGDLVSAVGISGVDFHVLTNLPSFEWDRIVRAAIQAAFNQSADAYSVKLSGGGAQVTTVNGGFSSIQVSDSATYHTNRISPSKLADCLNKTLSSIYAMTFTEYHQLFSTSVLPLFQNKLVFETQSMESLLVAKGLQFADIEGKSVAEVITQLTGLTTANIGCLYPWSSTFISTDLGKTFANANTTRLCNNFLGLSLHDIVVKISETADKVCFLCPVVKPCLNNAVCTDIPNAFICTCNQGYTGDGITNCDDILECQLNLHSCHVNATCRDTSGTYQCTCNSGFLGNGTVCVDTDECDLDPNRCSAKGICVNTIGGYYCRCETGYQWNGTACADINECTTNKHNCHAAAICTNTIGSFSCACGSGLTGNGLHCEDILECNFQTGLYPCHAKAKCTELFASYRCECNAGYTGDGKNCNDINECDTDTDDCNTNALCFNTQPGFVCQCKTGFTGDGKTCSDIIECDTGLDNCHKDANCVNTVGSFTCDCKDGFNGNGTYCYVAQVSFVRNAHVVTEGGNVVVTISLSGAIDSLAVVSIALGGTATKTVDYTTSAAAVLFQVNGPTTKTVTITTKDDTKLEATETINLTLSSPSNHVVPGGIVTTIVTIVDNDAVTVTLSTSTYNVNEGNGFAPVVVQINSGTVEREIIVNVTTVSSGSATTNVDYTPHTEEIRFSPGNLVAKLVRIPITNDNLTESNEQFTVVLSTTDNDVNLLTKTATVVIQDDDVATVKFEKSNYPAVGEGDSIVTVKVLLIGSLAIPVTARLTASNAGAVRDKDYKLPGNLDVTFVPNGSTTASITFTILQDTIVENNENFLVTLSSQSSPSLIVVTPKATAITIIDDDVLSVSFVPTTYSTEEEFSVVKVNVVVTGTFEKSLVLSISTADNTAKVGADYVSLVATPLIFNVGDPKEKEISVQILEDVLIEGTESFYVQMSSIDAKITFPNGKQAQINIVDDDVATAFIPATSYLFQEGATSSNIPVVLTGSLAIPVTVSLSTVHDTAKWPSDFTAISNFEIEFTPSGLKTKTLTLDIKNDDVVEGTEKFYVDLTTTSSYVSIGTYNRTSVLIQDNDELHVRFSSNRYTADENLRYAQVGLVLDKFLETSARVRLTPFNGTATAPEDFPLIIYDVTLDPGQPSRTVYYKINITDDMLEEYSEHFFVSLTALSSNVKTAQPNVSNITIAESDDINFCDPNARRYPCHIKADCVDVPSSFVCTCITGYQGNGLDCQNTNECNTIVCPFNATCQDTVGSYKCVCPPGYVGDGVDCRDINECADKTDDCHAQATCTNTLGSFDCQCNSGYEGDGKVCTDINECQRSLDNCHANATCTNIDGSFQCRCLQGYRGNGVQCGDINECNEQSDNCHNKATCANTEGSFTCTCKTGYSGDGITCSDINECTSSTHDCHVNASCTNMPPGSFSCACLSGFEGNGRNCTDINECDRNTDNCPTNAVCRNTIGSFFCECNPGFTHDGTVCKDDDECIGSNNCHSDARCVNEPGSFRCVCKTGFTGDGRSCTNLDECLLNPGPCHKYANCTDTHGSFVCNCMSGFTGNGTYCEDMIDCIFEPRKYPCDVRASCTDVPGGFTCSCPSGFSLNADKRNCDDLDECQSASTFTCHVNASCVNTDGSYNCKCNKNFVGDGKKTCVDTTCSSGNPCSSDALCSVNVSSSSFNCVCNDGFTGDGYTCNDINECNIPGKCGANTNCVNQPRASFTCTCKPGFTGDPYQICNDINECLNNPCHANWAKCNNYPGGHTCVCNPGFSGDGVNCEDIDECKDPSTCDSNADCKNEDGNYTCTCRKGYSGDGKTCTDINECLSNPCHAWATCNNYAGGHSCVCNSGYTGNGINCEDINECQSKPCEIGADCVNNPGSYQCMCPENLYRNGNFCHVFCPFKLDLAFIVDTSQSIVEADFLKVKNFMTESVAKMEIGENGNHIAAIAFGNIAEIFMDFNTISGQDLTRAAVINKLSNFTQLGGLTRIDLALLLAERNVFTQANGMRTSDQIRKVAVVITDGEQTTGQGVPVERLQDIAGRLQAKDITVLAIGVGANVPRHQMLNITNSIEENILEVNSFDNLLSVIFQFINISCTDIDECKRYNPCHVNANCKDTLGAYSCLCKIGYTGNGFQCQDVDECASSNSNSCDQNAKCNNTVGSYTCTCNSGYTGNGRQCQEINECVFGTHNCHSNATCINEQGSFRCVCKSGFNGNGSSCTNINECIPTNPCHQRASCEDNDGSYSCKCNGGYSGDGKQCTDTDECANDDDNNCDSNANCTNLEGSFKCVCRPGYTGDGSTCTVAGCDPRCSSKTVCKKETGGYKCVCVIGFSGDGTTCTDVNECMSNPCDVNANCTNTDGSFTCACKTGYTGDEKQCQDVDECASSNSNSCDQNAKCDNIVGSYTCTCNSGYTANGTQCQDIDECTIGTHNCHSNASCINNQGAFDCVCKSGFTGNGTSCTDIQCDPDCGSKAVCALDSMGGTKCVCRDGYTGNGMICTDVNECMPNNPCHANGDCTNTVGSFTCACKIGYTGDGKQCQDVDECASSNSNSCDQNAKCDNTVGSYTCTCNSGYTGNGRQCQDINECTTGTHNCHSKANCNNNQGSFDCACKSGFAGDGITCTDINECTTGTHNCHSNANCNNNQGSFDCACKSGFAGDGITCTDNVVNKCFALTSPCGVDQSCKSYDNGSYECFCTSPGRFLHNGVCIDVSTVSGVVKIISELFTAALSNPNSVDYYILSKALVAEIDKLFTTIYGTKFIGSAVTNLSNGSLVVNYLLVFKPNLAPSVSALSTEFWKHLTAKMLGPYIVSTNAFKDYNECNPNFSEHVKDCPIFSYCVDKYGSYSCECLSGYEKDPDYDICVTEDDGWWIIYAVVFASILFVVLCLICLFYFLEFTRSSKELYTLHDDLGNESRMKHDKRIDEEVAPGFPGSVPRTSSTGSQLLLSADRKSQPDSERLAMYEVNPIYDSANG